MRVLVIFVVACVALASGKSTFKREPANNIKTLLQRMLNKANLKPSLEARLAEIRQAIEAPKRSCEEDDCESGSSAMDCKIPCASTENPADFNACVQAETSSILTEFGIIRYALAGDALFAENDISDLVAIRFDSSKDIEERKQLENEFYEQAEDDFFDGLVEDDFDEATWSVIEELDCKYTRLREEYYSRLE